MQRYACIDKDGNVIWADRSFPEQPADPVGKGWRIVPVMEDKPAYDSATHELFKVGLEVRSECVAELWQTRPLPPSEPDLIEERFRALEARIAALEGEKAAKADKVKGA